MWVPKWQRDQDQGVDSPIPTQVVSNEEFVPRPQTKHTEAMGRADCRPCRREIEEGGNAAPRLHAKFDGVGYGLSRVEHDLW